MTNSPDKMRLLAKLSQLLLDYENAHPEDSVELQIYFHEDNVGKYVWNHETLFNRFE